MDFVIPKGADFDFTIKVLQEESYLPQDLTNMEQAVFKLFDIKTMQLAHTAILTVKNAAGGCLQGHIPASVTETFKVERGPKEDKYYLKPGYQASILVSFTDNTNSITVLIPEVYVAPTGG